MVSVLIRFIGSEVDLYAHVTDTSSVSSLNMNLLSFLPETFIFCLQKEKMYLGFSPVVIDQLQPRLAVM